MPAAVLEALGRACEHDHRQGAFEMKVTVADESITAVQIAAQAAGYTDVDVEQFPEKVKITATGPKGTVALTKPTLAEVCAEFVGRVTS